MSLVPLGFYSGNIQWKICDDSAKYPVSLENAGNSNPSV